MSFTRLAIVVLALSSSLPCLAQAPVVRPGECVYLYGAPPGAPAAATEEFAHGTRVYDLCTYSNAIEVGRDAPHRVTGEITLLGGSVPRGCIVTGWSEHRFRVGGAEPVRVMASAAGDARGVIESLTDGFDPAEVVMTLAVLELRADDSERVLASERVIRHQVGTSRVVVDDLWGRTLVAHAQPGALIAVRLTLELIARSNFRLIDFGAPGTGRGVGYATVDVCLTSLSQPAAASDLDLERDLYERRCLPALWMPAAHAGRLEQARALVARLVDAAEATGDAGANVVLARSRLARSSEEEGRAEYQRACRSLSDAVRALTTP